MKKKDNCEPRRSSYEQCRSGETGVNSVTRGQLSQKESV